MTFLEALKLSREGRKVKRSRWSRYDNISNDASFNGSPLYLEDIEADDWQVEAIEVPQISLDKLFIDAKFLRVALEQALYEAHDLPRSKGLEDKLLKILGFEGLGSKV